jgi:ribosomal-protein-alanine N-acetyltransferase
VRRFFVNEQLKTPSLTGNKTLLRPKKLTDAVNDYRWRTDPELCRFDAVQPLTYSFEKYLKYYADILCYNDRDWNFAIETHEYRHIGNCSLFNTDKKKKETEIGIMIGDKAYWEHGYGTDTLLAVVNHVFTHTDIHRIYLKTLDWNKRAQKCFAKCGFSVYGKMMRDGYTFITMEIICPHMD